MESSDTFTGNSVETNRLLVPSRDAAQMLAVSERTLWQLRQKGEIPFLRIGKLVRYPVADLEDWIARNRKRGS